MMNIRNTNGGDFGTFVHVLNQIKHLKEKSASRNIRELLCLFTFYRFITTFFFSLLVCLEDFFFFPFGERRCIFAFPLVLLFFSFILLMCGGCGALREGCR